MAYGFTSQKALRAEFRRQHPDLSRQRLNLLGRPYPTDTRVAWVDWIDHLQRSGQISEALAQRATLE